MIGSEEKKEEEEEEEKEAEEEKVEKEEEEWIIFSSGPIATHPHTHTWKLFNAKKLQNCLLAVIRCYKLWNL